jgi:hypothetical protein
MFGSILVAGACHDDDDNDEVVMVWTEWLVLNNIKYCLHRRCGFLLFVYCFYSSLVCCAILWRRRMMMLAQGVLYFLWMRERSVCPFVHAEK